MKRISRQLVMTLSVLFMMLVISGCGSPLQKPTGLEIEKQPIAEVVDNASKDAIEDEVPDEETVPDTVVQEKVADKEEVRAEQKETPAPPKQESVQEEKKLATVAKAESKSANKRETNQQSSKPAENAKPSTVANKPANQPASESTKSTTVTQPEVVKPAPTPPEKPATVPETKASTVVYSIVISASEIPLPPTTMDIKDGDTVLKALINITKKNRVQMDYRGGQGATAYVEGIDNVYEFDRGQGSGWMYRVNGIFPDRGAGVVPLLDGDRVEWLYTTNLGVDLNANLKPFRRSE